MNRYVQLAMLILGISASAQGTAAYPGASTGDPGSVVLTPALAGSNEHSAIRAVWSQVDAAWNARDAQAFSRLYAEDASFTFVQRGESLNGRSTIFEHFSERFPRFAPDLRHRTRIDAIQPIGPGVFTADGNVEILRVSDVGDEPPEVLRTFAIFAVMGVHDDEWSIRALRIYQLSPSGAGAD